jgi:ferric-dicitrate binding protein FerR (iron transport regulator)
MAYQQYTSEEFIQDENFRGWVFDPSEEAGAFWENFLINYPEKRSEIIKARALLLAMKQFENNPSIEQGQRMWSNILDQVEDSSNTSKSVFQTVYRNFSRHWVSIAAMLVLVSSLGWFLWNRGEQTLPQSYEKQIAEAKVQLIESTNQTKETQKVVLPDGSEVELYPEARLSYEKDFSGTQRKVYLSGKGYFEVVKDVSKPFLVFSNNVVTQVVGTSFTINSPKNASGVSVIVKSGKVKVFTIEQLEKAASKTEEGLLVLTPNQQATYDPVRNSLTRTITAKPEIIRSPEKYPDFNFKDTDINEVFTTLESSYGVTIEYDQQTFVKCSLTAQLGSEPLFKKLDIICKTIDATYEVWGTKIVVTGKGCNAF